MKKVEDLSDGPRLGLGVLLIILILAAWFIHYGWACSLMPVEEGGKIVQSRGVIIKKSTSVGHCIAQCFKIEECTGVNYLRKEKLCEVLYLPVDPSTLISYNSSIHVTMIRGTAPGTLRLVDGSSERDGRVEIFFDSTWGTVCDDDWDDEDAGVVCRKLGFCQGKSRLGHSYRPGSGPIHLHEVNCNGNESSLLNCRSKPGPGQTCTHETDAGALCTACNVRLVDGASPAEGRVEVFVNGSMGTICDDGWDDMDAAVVCRELGYCNGVARKAAYFGPGSGPIHLDNVNCDGTENSVLDCSAIGDHNCDHMEDVGVVCSFEYPCFRLVDGTNLMEGRIELFKDNQWGTICDDKWTDKHARVMCRQLGFCGGIAKLSGFFGPGKGEIYLDDVKCTGSEMNILDCPASDRRHNCGHNEDVGVICSPCDEP